MSNTPPNRNFWKELGTLIAVVVTVTYFAVSAYRLLVDHKSTQIQTQTKTKTKKNHE